MMMTPEQYAEIQAKTQPLLEKLVEVLNELNELSTAAGQPVVTGHGEIMSAGGTAVYRHYVNKWEIQTQR